MKLLRAEEHRRMPWKNGGGETTEIAVSPPDAGLDDFDWRVSMARVDGTGPFSSFAGVDRTLTVLDGAGLLLSVEGRASVTLTTGSKPLTFAADLPTRAELIDGPINDLNVMTRRGWLTHSVVRKGIAGRIDLQPQAGMRMLVVHAGRVRIEQGDEAVDAGQLDAVILGEQAAVVAGKATFFVIGIHGGAAA